MNFTCVQPPIYTPGETGNVNGNHFSNVQNDYYSVQCLFYRTTGTNFMEGANTSGGHSIHGPEKC